MNDKVHNLSAKVKLAAITLALPFCLANVGVNYYKYDARGRLVSQCKAFTSDGEYATYALDGNSNRRSYINAKVDIGLQPNSGIYSPNGRFMFWFQGDGNLVAYGNFGNGWTPLGWATNTVGSGANVAYFQSDGNLVLYGPNGSVWSSNTYGNPCASIAVANDGNVTITSTSGAVIWQTNTGGH